MSEIEISHLAEAVDDAITALDEAVHAYADAALEMNAAHYRRHNTYHPRYSKPGDWVKVAVASRPRLARTLDLMPANPRTTVADATAGVPAGN